MSVKMQSLLDDCDKEIKTEVRMRELEEHKKHDITPLTFLLYRRWRNCRLDNASSLNPAFTASLPVLFSIKGTLMLVVTSIITPFLSSVTS